MMITISIGNAACIPLTPDIVAALAALGEDTNSLNRLEWPAGASNHARGMFLVHSDEAKKLTGGDLTEAVTLTMTDDTMAGTDGVISADKMYQIEHRPVHVRVSPDGSVAATLYVVKLVDERYFWKGDPITGGYNLTLPWDRTQYYQQSKNSGTAWTWTGMLADVYASAGLTSSDVSVTVDTSSAGTPTDYLFNGDSVGDAIDRICSSLGAVFVANLSAAAGAKRYTICQPFTLNANIEKHNDKFLSERTMGGVVWVYGGGVDWLSAIMPASVKVYFPRQLPGNLVDSQASSAPPILNRFYTHESTNGKPPGKSGRTGNKVAIYDSLWAIGSIGSETNATALNSRADFLAAAYYQRFWIDHSHARMRGFENVGPVPGSVVWQLHVNGPYTDILTNGMWGIYGGDKDVLAASRPPRIVGMGDVQTWGTFDGATYVGNCAEKPWLVIVKTDGGADAADNTHAATYTYSLYSPGDTSYAHAIATALTPKRARWNGFMVAAADGTYGLAARDTSGNIMLLDAYGEARRTQPCSS